MTAVSNSYTPQLAISRHAVKRNSPHNPGRTHTRHSGKIVLRIGNFFLDDNRILCFRLLARWQRVARRIHTQDRENFSPTGNASKSRHFAPFSRRARRPLGTRGAFTPPVITRRPAAYE